MDSIVYSDSGKVVGSINESGIFTKIVKASNMLRSPKAWCFDVSTIDNTSPPIKGLKIIVEDTKTEYEVGINKFRKHAGTLDRGYGKQYYLTLEHWYSYTSMLLEDATPEDTEFQIKMGL